MTLEACCHGLCLKKLCAVFSPFFPQSSLQSLEGMCTLVFVTNGGLRWCLSPGLVHPTVFLWSRASKEERPPLPAARTGPRVPCGCVLQGRGSVSANTKWRFLSYGPPDVHPEV